MAEYMSGYAKVENRWPGYSRPMILMEYLAFLRFIGKRNDLRKYLYVLDTGT